MEDAQEDLVDHYWPLAATVKGRDQKKPRFVMVPKMGRRVFRYCDDALPAPPSAELLVPSWVDSPPYLDC
jgi:hypothetical protein